jgi:hypothetical protein
VTGEHRTSGVDGPVAACEPYRRFGPAHLRKHLSQPTGSVIVRCVNRRNRPAITSSRTSAGASASGTRPANDACSGSRPDQEVVSE